MSEEETAQEEQEQAEFDLLKSNLLIMPEFNYNNLTRASLGQAMLPTRSPRSLNLYAFASALHDVLNAGMVPPRPAMLQLILEKHGDLTRKLNRQYPMPTTDEPVYLGLDTGHREEVMWVLANHFTGMAWPSNGDPTEHQNQFRLKLEDALEEAGWRTLFGVQ
ncbi:MAG: hypothetical protein EOP83_01705 [Verrucomicrobiaceae bacterium]|nr:MAG: hypothetical protein EOP83_01705 [Verrucomicrobiaceae bacterium]